VVVACNSTKSLLHLVFGMILPKSNNAHHRKNGSFLDGRKSIWYDVQVLKKVIPMLTS
jgi:hypothetical protein